MGQSPEVEGPLQCRRAQAPRNSSHGVNRLAADNWDPLYRLQLSDLGLHEYKGRTSSISFKGGGDSSVVRAPDS